MKEPDQRRTRWLLMGFYRRKIFPRLMNAGMSSERETPYRVSTLAGVRGEVLEIGFGTGLNLPRYPDGVQKITAIDVNPGMNELAERHVRESGIEVDLREADAQHLPFPDGSFDSVVSTWTLCSIPDVEQALREIYRVLKPGGQFFFVEHGLSNEPRVQKWQHRLTPLQKRIADGCHLNRNMRALIKKQPWRVERLDEFYAEQSPKIVGYLYQGIAVK